MSQKFFALIFAASLLFSLPAFAAGATPAAPTSSTSSTSSAATQANDLFSAFARQGDDEKKAAPAINQYSNKYKKNFSGKPLNQSLLPQEDFSVYLVSTGASDDSVILRISAPSSITGCAQLKQPTYEASQQGQILWIKIGGPAIEIEKAPRYDQYDCRQNNQNVSLDIPLSRAMIQSTPIKKIALRSTNHTDYYDVEMIGERLQLTAETQAAFHPRTMNDGSDPLAHWFYPENTIVLFMPGAAAGSDFSQEIRQLAYAQGLIPLTDMMQGFQPPANQPNTIYFVDPSGHFARNVNAQSKTVFFGRITSEREVRATLGVQKKGESLDVYAKTPYLPG